MLILLPGLLTARSLTASDLGNLGSTYYGTGQYYLSYIFSLSEFMLSDDDGSDEARLLSGLGALKSCAAAGRPEEGLFVNDLLMKEGLISPDFYGSAAFFFHLQNRDLESTLALRDNGLILRDDYGRFLSAYDYFLRGDYSRSSEELSEITEEFSRSKDTVSLALGLGSEPVINRKSPFLAGFFSGVVPGAGQVYSGLYFDAANSLAFTGLTGACSWVLWDYALEDGASGGRLVLPVLSTLAFTAFYISNIYNAVSGTRRVNEYARSRYYDSLMKGFISVFNDRDVWLTSP